MHLFKTPPIVKKLFFNRKWGFPLNKNVVYLTFDDGPHPAITPWILDELNKNKIINEFKSIKDFNELLDDDGFNNNPEEILKMLFTNLNNN